MRETFLQAYPGAVVVLVTLAAAVAIILGGVCAALIAIGRFERADEWSARVFAVAAVSVGGDIAGVLILAFGHWMLLS